MLSISTKTGDTGQTGLANGQRLPKSDPLFEVVGTLDELNSWLGLVAAKLESRFPDKKKFLYQIQDTLFYIGAELAQAPKTKLSQAQVTKLEKAADALQASMSANWHTKFLLPGGTELGAHLDIARTVCRRCERLVVLYSQSQPVEPVILRYLNRLSDYLYLLRCFVNNQDQYAERKFEQKEKKP